MTWYIGSLERCKFRVFALYRYKYIDTVLCTTKNCPGNCYEFVTFSGFRQLSTVETEESLWIKLWKL